VRESVCVNVCVCMHVCVCAVDQESVGGTIGTIEYQCGVHTDDLSVIYPDVLQTKPPRSR